MSETISIDQLQPADILLYHGTSVLSRAIRLFDGTDVSHSSLYVGNNKVSEAIGDGLIQRDYSLSMEGQEWTQCRRLKESATMVPVLDRAAFYVSQGNRYAYEQIILLAFLCLIRKPKVTPILRSLIRDVLDGAASMLTRLADGGRQPMICSEFVYRSYDEALPEPKDIYSLGITGLARVERFDISFSGGTSKVLNVEADRGLSQGLHPHSLLAFVRSDLGRTWTANKLDAARFAPISRIPPTTAQIEEKIEQYFEEIKDSSKYVASETVDLEDLGDAIDHFAVRLYSVKTSHPLVEVSSDTLRPSPQLIYRSLYRTAADFITPGDLYRSQSLVLLGRITN